MANVDGTWEIVTMTPIGEQRATLTIVSDGATFTGTSVSTIATLDLEDGKIDGDSISWIMRLTAPMKMKLEGTAIIDGDTISGKIKAGVMGTSSMTGKRVA